MFLFLFAVLGAVVAAVIAVAVAVGVVYAMGAVLFGIPVVCVIAIYLKLFRSEEMRTIKSGLHKDVVEVVGIAIDQQDLTRAVLHGGREVQKKIAERMGGKSEVKEKDEEEALKVAGARVRWVRDALEEFGAPQASLDRIYEGMQAILQRLQKEEDRDFLTESKGKMKALLS